MYEHINNEVLKNEMDSAFEKIKHDTNGFELTGSVVSLVGATGVGKTVISNAYGEDDAAEILVDREGHGLASLVPTNTHPTDIVPKGTVLIVAHLKKDIMNIDKQKDFFVGALYNAGNSILKKTNTNTLTYDQVKNEFKKDLKNHYHNAILKNDNTSFAHMFSFLTAGEKEDVIGKMVNAFGEIPIHELIELIREINTTAKKDTEEKQITQALQELLDSDWSEYSQVFWKHCRELTDKIKNSTLIHGNYDEGTNSLYIWLTKETPIEEREMFLSSEDKSVEFLFEKMDIYYRISDKMLDFINQHTYAREMLKTRFGYTFFTIRDFMGLFHKSDDVKEAVKEARSYIYNNKSNLILFCISSKEDALNKKALMVLKELKASIKRNVDILVLLPRVDELVPQLNSKSKPQTRFNRGEERQSPNIDTLIKKINERKEYVRDSLNSITVDSKRCIQILDIIPYGMYSDDCPDEIIKEFDPNQAFQSIISNLARTVYQNTRKIHVNVNRDSDDIAFDWSNNNINQLISTMITSNAVFKTSVYIPVITNISNNMNLMGHGNSSRSVVNNSEFGYGHNGSIDMNWFVNVVSINIQFPTMLWKVVSGIINNSILQNVKLKFGSFASKEDENLFNDLLTSTFSQGGNLSVMHTGRRLAAKLFYYNHINPLKQQGFFSYSILLQNSLKRCFSSYTKWNTGNVDEIVWAYKEVVMEVCNTIKDTYIVFDK